MGRKIKVSKSLRKAGIWRLWSGAEVVRINQSAGGGLVTEEKIKLRKSLRKEESGGSGVAQKLLELIGALEEDLSLEKK